MAKEAERLLSDTGWLPEPLRLVEAEQTADIKAESETADLPDFLAGDDEDAIDADNGSDPAHMIAAE